MFDREVCFRQPYLPSWLWVPCVCSMHLSTASAQPHVYPSVLAIHLQHYVAAPSCSPHHHRFAQGYVQPATITTRSYSHEPSCYRSTAEQKLSYPLVSSEKKKKRALRRSIQAPLQLPTSASRRYPHQYHEDSLSVPESNIKL